jgi:hypothetical protein
MDEQWVLTPFQDINQRQELTPRWPPHGAEKQVVKGDSPFVCLAHFRRVPGIVFGSTAKVQDGAKSLLVDEPTKFVARLRRSKNAPGFHDAHVIFE